ncbi:transporter family protein [Halpernia humi]|uniref:Transporter family protein n=1 Tax=Halpernia humi TaxID=493375 RepID=A0A1H5ZXR8_9FLAO|nr:EamA family transporter [Halpernia humi]SEG40774.1 transporter family protein [Halpernia humi]
MWWIYALLAAFFAALTAIFAKIGVENVNSNLATAIRTIVVLIMISAIVYFRNEYKNIGEITSKTWFFLTISGVCTGLSWIFYFKALQIGEVSKVAGVDKLSLALTIIFSIVFLGETVSWKAGFGALLIIIGTILLIFK